MLSSATFVKIWHTYFTEMNALSSHYET